MISDDQTWSMFNRSLMPNVYSQLVDHGTLFDRAYANTPLCCPSRSQIFTGLYATNTNVDVNSDPLTRPTLMQALHDSGYRTLLAGKFLNSHPCTTPLPEFDEWYCYGKENSSEKNPVVSIGGKETQMTGYSADIFANFVKHFIATTPVDQPFFAIYSPKDPHFPANDDRFDNIAVPLHRPPSFNEDTTADNKPAYVQRGPLTAAEIATIDTTYTKMYRSSHGVDIGVGSILSSLGSRAANTIVYFISDNGVMLGEHRIPSGKVVPYEESVRVPMVVRNPLVQSASHPVLSHALVENVDIAPTIAEQAGITWHADGSYELVNHANNPGARATTQSDLAPQLSPRASVGPAPPDTTIVTGPNGVARTRPADIHVLHPDVLTHLPLPVAECRDPGSWAPWRAGDNDRTTADS